MSTEPKIALTRTVELKINDVEMSIIKGEEETTIVMIRAGEPHVGLEIEIPRETMQRIIDFLEGKKENE
jgi:hypothetical protein